MRWANVSDSASLAALNAEFNGVTRTKEEVEQSLADARECVAIVELNKELVGFACAQIYHSFCYPDAQGEITEMYIKEFARGNGYSTMLLAFLEAQLYEKGVSDVRIITGKYNEIAQKVYERSNYEKKEHITFHKCL